MVNCLKWFPDRVAPAFDEKDNSTIYPINLFTGFMELRTWIKDLKENMNIFQ